MDELFLVGHNISYSLSPSIYNGFFKENGINARYFLFDVAPEDFDFKIRHLLLNENLRGFNVTQPYKVRIMLYLNALSSDADEIGTVNCVSKQGRLLKGFNTGKAGFVRSMEKYAGLIKGECALVLGAGGVAPAVVSGLLEIGVRKVFIANRTFEKAVRLASRFYGAKGIPFCEIPDFASQCRMLVNATTVGLHGEKSLIPESAINPGQILYDLIYNPEETDFLKIGKEKGAIVINGIEMLKKQAEENLRIWGYKK